MASSLLGLLEPDLSETDRLIETQKLSRAMAQGDLTLKTVVGRILGKNPEADQLLLLLDQFEELYTLCSDDGQRKRFLAELLAAVEHASQSHTPPMVILITLRADFMSQALGYRPFADALQESTFLIGPMNAEELQQAITMPAKKQGADFEDG